MILCAERLSHVRCCPDPAHIFQLCTRFPWEYPAFLTPLGLWCHSKLTLHEYIFFILHWDLFCTETLLTLLRLNTCQGTFSCTCPLNSPWVPTPYASSTWSCGYLPILSQTPVPCSGPPCLSLLPSECLSPSAPSNNFGLNCWGETKYAVHMPGVSYSSLVSYFLSVKYILSYLSCK